MSFDLDTYLRRIGVKNITADLEGLKKLQSAQITSIPFENVVPFSGRVPELDPASLWQKLVLDRCGGYCFELNSLLGQALDGLGYSRAEVLARVRMGAPEGGARSHLAHVVDLDGTEWLVDAGFGGQAPAEPINLSTADTQQIRDQVYRVRVDEDAGEEVLERMNGTGWVSLYGFDRLAPRKVDIEAANYLCATWPEAPFSSNLKFYRLTEYGWISFQNGAAGFTSNGVKDTRRIVEAGELGAFMKDDLGLGYPEPVVRTLADRLAQLPVPDMDP